VLVTLIGARSARAEDAPAPASTKVAVGFSNLLARIDKDEIGLAKPEYRVHILEALRGAGFNAVGAENLVFNKDDSDKADYVLGGTVTELDCITYWSTLRCRIAIEWQLLDRERDEVVYQVLTRFVGLGLSQQPDPSVGKLLTLGALSRLMARPRFFELLNAERLALPSEATYPAATFRSCTAKARQLPGDFEVVADGTVLIKSRDGLGSGFFLGPDGLVMTAAHVMSTGSAEVRLHDGQTVKGQVVRISHKQDVALIALAGAGSATARSCLALATSQQTPGMDVYAIGSPASEELAFSLSRGIVSGVRTVRDVPLIQTDAPVSPGNSGGALVDQQGRVVGVVSRKIAGRAVEGLGFAIPIQAALAALQLEPGTVTAPILLPQGAVPDEPQPKKNPLVVDTPDPLFSLEPEVEQQRLWHADYERRVKLWNADYERRVKEQRASRPGYLLPMRWGGVAVATAGAIASTVSWAKTNEAITHEEYRAARLTNDLGWAAIALGTGAFITSFVLEPKLPPARAQQVVGWSLVPGPGNLKVDVTF